jgi:hypothetical protein
MERAEKRLGSVGQRHRYPTAGFRRPVLTVPLYELPQPVWLQGAAHQKYFRANENSEISDCHKDGSRVFGRNVPVPPGSFRSPPVPQWKARHQPQCRDI